ncbi:MAG TPA: GyrI-like domain-containing protein [Candidatus Acidoferrales bacterium]|nr:GyrI-like domain-containing protein [Candidatus Acidoferrales bacterium]
MTILAERPAVALVPKRGEIRIRTIPARRILKIDGEGRPDGPAFRAAVEALYPVAYGVHFALGRRGIDAPVGTLEGLWSFDPTAAPPAPTEPFIPPDADTWRWTLFLELPETATDAEVLAAVEGAQRRRPAPELAELRDVWFEEGLVVEALHVGPYATEPETIARMATAAAEAGLERCGPHHEIYLGDPRRSAPERLRTLLREPVAPRREA